MRSGAPTIVAAEWRGRSPQRRVRVALAGACVVAAIAAGFLVHLGARQYLGYDSIWHVFIARQPSWSSFWTEVRDNAHPPLFYLLLRVCVAVFGKWFLAYRATSIVAVAASTLLVAWLVVRLSGNAVLAVLASAAFGLSASSIEIGLEVRSYALFLAFMLAGLSFYLEWLEARPGRASPGARAGFAASLSLAVLSHYSAVFVLGASMAAPLILAAMHPRWRVRFRRELSQHKVAVAATFGVPVSVTVAMYVLHVRFLPHGFNHVAGFVFDARIESRIHFVLRTSRELVLCFIPVIGLHGPGATAVVLVLAFGLAWLMTRRAARGQMVVVPFVMLVVMVLVNLAAGLGGRYPFGGNMRHEIFLFPFALLCLFIGLDLLRRSLHGRWCSKGIWNATAAAGVAVTVWMATSTFPVATAPLGQEALSRFEGYFVKPPAVLTDQFSFILVFGKYHQWSWSLRWQDPRQPMWQVWDLSLGDAHFAVCRDREWSSDLSLQVFYQATAACLRHAAVDRVAAVRLMQSNSTVPWRLAETPALARKLAPAAGLSVESMFLDHDDVYGLFAAAR